MLHRGGTSIQSKYTLSVRKGVQGNVELILIQMLTMTRKKLSVSEQRIPLTSEETEKPRWLQYMLSLENRLPAMSESLAAVCFKATYQSGSVSQPDLHRHLFYNWPDELLASITQRIFSSD